MGFTVTKETSKRRYSCLSFARLLTFLFRLWRMTELQREMILAERAEEIQKVIDARALSSMVAHRQSVSSVLSANRISTPEPSQDNDPAPTPESPGNAYPTPTESLSAPTPRSTLHEHPLHSNQSPAPLFARSPTPEVYPDASLSDLERCRLSRRLVLRFFKMTWFGKYIQGMWVRCQTSSGRYEISQVNGEYLQAVSPPNRLFTTILFHVSVVKRNGTTIQNRRNDLQSHRGISLWKRHQTSHLGSHIQRCFYRSKKGPFSFRSILMLR
jgi:hypothetical protein